MPAHFENDEKCDGSKILASVHTIPARFDYDRKFDSNKLFAFSPQEFNAKERYEKERNERSAP